MSDRELVKLVTVDTVEPVDGADNLDRVTVGGWHVVSQKGLYRPGDKAWYFEIDSLLPLENPAFEFLATRGVKEVDGKKYHRLKTIKLRGQISQGLLVPFDELEPQIGAFHKTASPGAVTNHTEALGVLKYDDVVTVNMGNSDTAGSFPTKYGSKTDAERAQNLTKYWNQIKEYEWYATEKIDGCSLSVFRDEDGNLRVCSRNWEIKDGANPYWNAVRQYQEQFDTLRPGTGIQTEIYGEGIQGNRLGVTGKHIAVFNYLFQGRAVDQQDWPGRWRKLSVPAYNLDLPDTVEEAIAQVDGIKSLISPSRLAEGVVWTQEDGVVPPFLGRHCFKVISNTYLLKEK